MCPWLTQNAAKFLIDWEGLCKIHTFKSIFVMRRMIGCSMRTPYAQSLLACPDVTLDRLHSNSFASTSALDVRRDLQEGPGLASFIQGSNLAPPAPRSGALGKGSPSLFVETYGCQQNVADSEIVRSVLADTYRQAGSAEEADVVLINTCSIREKAEAKIFSRLGKLQKQKLQSRMEYRRSGGETRKAQVIGVLGCMAERLKEKLLDTHKLADVVAGPDAYRDLPRLLSAVSEGGSRGTGAMNVQLSLEETYADIVPLRPQGVKSAFLSIMRGCNNLCSFCIVPFTRGRERSRPMGSILDEVRMLSDEGVKEVTLLGQNVNSYADFSQEARWHPHSDAPFGLYAQGFESVYKPRRGGAVRFAELLESVAAIDPEMRVWFTSPHPKEFSDEVLDVIRGRDNVAKMVHMPAQSGSTSVLASMRRGYSRGAYDALADHIRDVIPGVALSTDMIAGFCGETEEDHRQSVDLMHRMSYEQAFLFAYSKRDKTHAARNLQDDVDPEVKKRRLQELIEAFRERQATQNQAEVGRVHLVLVEGASREGDSHTGRTATMKRVKMPLGLTSPSLREPSQPIVELQPGDYAAMRVTHATAGTLFGTAIARTSAQEFVAAYGGPVPLDGAACLPSQALVA